MEHLSYLLLLVGGISAAGEITTAGCLITEDAIQKDAFDTAQKIINEDREATKAIESLLEEFGKQAQELMVEKGLNVGLTGASMIKNCSTIVRAGATAASEGGEALFRGLSIAGRAAYIGGFAFSAFLFPLDIYTFVTSSMVSYFNSLLVRNSEIHNRATRHSNKNLMCPKYKRKTEGGRTFTIRTIKAGIA